MAAPRAMYQIIGRYMTGKEVTAYRLISYDKGVEAKFSREATAYLVGRGQVSNCTGQVNNGTLILRGVGMELKDLPVCKNSDGTLSRTNNLEGHIRRGMSPEDVMASVMIVASIQKGTRTIGYWVQTTGGQRHELTRDKVIELAKVGKVRNARTQLNNGELILRGNGCDIRSLPVDTRN